MTAPKQTMDTLTAMRLQEDSAYVAIDWLHVDEIEKDLSVTRPLHHEVVDDECRNKMAQWCFQVIDYCGFNRETVEIAMSSLDRFMSTPGGRKARLNRQQFQLATMASLYTAIKINEPKAMDPQMISKLSRGLFGPKEIEQMESAILRSLNWRVNPPTSMSLARCLVDLIPRRQLDEDLREAVMKLTQLQAEVAVSSGYFIPVRSSIVAYSAVMNSLSHLISDDKVVDQCGFMFAHALKCNFDAPVCDALFDSLSQSLEDAVFNSYMPSTPKRDSEKRRGVARTKSPRGVVAL